MHKYLVFVIFFTFMTHVQSGAVKITIYPEVTNKYSRNNGKPIPIVLARVTGIDPNNTAIWENLILTDGYADGDVEAGFLTTELVAQAFREEGIDYLPLEMFGGQLEQTTESDELIIQIKHSENEDPKTIELPAKILEHLKLFLLNSRDRRQVNGYDFVHLLNFGITGTCFIDMREIADVVCEKMPLIDMETLEAGHTILLHTASTIFPTTRQCAFSLGHGLLISKLGERGAIAITRLQTLFDIYGGDQAVVLTCQGQNKPFYVSLERAHLEVHKIFLVNLVGTMALAMTMSLACSMF